jgi:hypothetical protein
MTAALHDEVGAVAPVRMLRVVRDTERAEAPVAATAPNKVIRRVGNEIVSAGSDPLLNGTARLLSIPVRHVYAALWRVGVLEVRG